MKTTPDEVFEMNRSELDQYIASGGVINLEVLGLITNAAIFFDENTPRDFQPQDLRAIAEKVPEFRELLEEINRFKKSK